MNSTDYTYLLKNPESIDALKTQQLEEIINEFPYFQSARVLWLNGLNKTNSYKYNSALKKTAAYTIDRKVLFDFITSPIFINKINLKEELLEDLEIIEVETVKALHQKITDNFTSSNEEIVPTITTQENTQQAAEVLELGKPIQFNSTEPQSFNEWMQLVIQKPIERDKKEVDKFSIIDKFIETNPKIKPIDKSHKNIDISSGSSRENDNLMTETLAKVYLEQKKYENAIKAYHILSLKYPEKSGFFADRIKAIKILDRKSVV